jgi:hypothetical protein
MKAECERCHESVELSFAPVAGGTQVSCPACKQEYFVASDVVDVTVPPVAVLEPLAADCPKCGLAGARQRGEACARCGLVFNRWSYALPTFSTGDDDAAAAVWSAVEANWDDSARHDAFLVLCQRTAQLPYAAARYRAAQAARGAAAEPQATRALERMSKLAFTALELSAKREPREPTRVPYRNTMAVLGLVLVLIVGGLIWAIFYQQTKATKLDEGEDRVLPAVPQVRPVPVAK